jgi:feruloyl esterase
MPKLDAAVGLDNALNSNLSAFKARGGKLIEYHDWDDAAFTPAWNMMYYDQVVKTVGHGDLAAVQKFYRLFMVPGVGHCGGGPGPNAFGEEGQPSVSDDPDHDAVSALTAWVEQGRAPDKLIATKFVADDPKQGVQLQRPLYPYPAEAVWNGSGDTNVASNFHASKPAYKPGTNAENAMAN